MSCPDTERLLLHVLGELTVNEASEIAAHGAVCQSCRGALREHAALLEDLRAPPPLATYDEEFTRQVLATCARAPAASTQKRRAPLIISLSVAAAAALAYVAAPRPDQERFTARGAAAISRSLAAEVMFVRERIFYPVAGARLAAGDALAVRCTNTTDAPSYLAVFALDAAGTAHWIYPSYLDPDSDPASIRISSGLRDHMLEEVAEPAQPAAGKMRVFALFTAQPLHVKAVEAQLPELRFRAPSEIWPTTHMQEWSATWTRH